MGDYPRKSVLMIAGKGGGIANEGRIPAKRLSKLVVIDFFERTGKPEARVDETVSASIKPVTLSGRGESKREGPARGEESKRKWERESGDVCQKTAEGPLRYVLNKTLAWSGRIRQESERTGIRQFSQI